MNKPVMPKALDIATAKARDWEEHWQRLIDYYIDLNKWNDARIRELEAALKEAELQRDSWKRIAESGLGIPQTNRGGVK
jgi:hypothetical protein